MSSHLEKIRSKIYNSICSYDTDENIDKLEILMDELIEAAKDEGYLEAEAAYENGEWTDEGRDE